MTMRHRGWTGLVSAALLTSMASACGAEVTPNPYAVIVTRNAFGLNPVSYQIQPAPPPAPGVVVYLTGIITLGGAKKVLLLVEDKTPGKKPEYLSPLVEGDVQGRVEVVSIDADKGAVLVRIDGNEKTLTFELDTPKPSGVAPAGPPPNPHVRPAMPGPPSGPPPAAHADAPPTPSGNSSVVVGGWNAPGSASASPPAAPSTDWNGVGRAANRAASGVPSMPPSAAGLR
jgi:hypothetical protein